MESLARFRNPGYDALGSASGPDIRLVYYLRHLVVHPNSPDWVEHIDNLERIASRTKSGDELEAARAQVISAIGPELLQAHPWVNQPPATFESMQLVVPSLFISSDFPARRLDMLKQVNITHIVQALPTEPPFPQDFSYKVVAIMDSPMQTVDFDSIVKWMEAAGPDAVFLVHCQAGISRSASICLAWLMYSKKLRLEPAYALLCTARDYCFPNMGFRRQLREYETRLFAAQ